MVLGTSVYNMAEVALNYISAQREMPKTLSVKGAKFSTFSEISILLVLELVHCLL